jgi:hypothetical protein
LEYNFFNIALLFSRLELDVALVVKN